MEPGSPNQPYNRLSLAAKQALQRDRQREPAIVCPRCETQTTVADSARHAASCPGPREPHPLSRWLTWKEVRARGVVKATIGRWVVSGKVRVKTVDGRRRFLERDIARQLMIKAGPATGTGEKETTPCPSASTSTSTPEPSTPSTRKRSRRRSDEP